MIVVMLELFESDEDFISFGLPDFELWLPDFDGVEVGLGATFISVVQNGLLSCALIARISNNPDSPNPIGDIP